MTAFAAMHGAAPRVAYGAAPAIIPDRRDPDRHGGRSWMRAILPAAGLLASGAAHAAFVAWAAGTSPEAKAEGPPAEAVAEVSLVSLAVFDAMLSEAPEVDPLPPEPSVPPAADADPPVTPLSETVPEFSAAPGSLPGPVPDAAPEAIASPAPPVGVRPDDPPAGVAANPTPETAPETASAAKPTEASSEAEAIQTSPARRTPARTAKAVDASGKMPAAASVAPSAPATGLSGAALKTAMSEWGAKLRTRIDRAKTYPRAARAAGQTGRVGLSIEVSPDGRILGVGVARSSGIAQLDAAAVEAVRRAGRLPKAPMGLAEPSYRFSLAVDFTL